MGVRSNGTGCRSGGDAVAGDCGGERGDADGDWGWGGDRNGA